MHYQRLMIFIVIAFPLFLLAACQPIQPVAPTADDHSAPTSATTAATEGTAAMTDNELIGVVWQWQGTQLNDDTTFTPVDPAQYTLTFLPENKVQMQADCNKGSGLYTLDGNQLSLGPIAMTLMACLPDSLDSTFSQQINEVGSYLLDNGKLVLGLKMDSGAMTFAPASQ